VRYLSLFSGIEAASVAWEPLGWKPVAFAEIEPHPCRVLAARYPHVPNLGDVTRITEADVFALGPIDVMIFGSPCQDLSLAGNRKGLDGERSGLFRDAIRIARWAREHCGLRWLLWENVFGAFSSNEGRDFAVVVGAMGGLDTPVEIPPKKWGNEGVFLGPQALVEWSTLDSQWFGVAQRRRRVFALADFGAWAGRPPVLLEPEGLRGDSAPRRGSWEDLARATEDRAGERGGEGQRGLFQVAGTLAVNAGPRSKDAGNFTSNQGVSGGYVLPFVSNAEDSLELPFLTASNLAKQFNNQQPLVVGVTGDVTHSLNTANNGKGCSEDGTGRGVPVVAYMPARKLAADGGVDEFFAERDVCDALHTAVGHGNKAPIICWTGDGQVADPLSANEQSTWTHEGMTFRMHNVIQEQLRVRRLTPVECELLQGFPVGWTLVGKVADGPRYKAIGNSMTTTVINWIGRSIEAASWDVWA
jgi:DNA (cytosine-5)-methyltransferase 1